MGNSKRAIVIGLAAAITFGTTISVLGGKRD
jgi:hypothetical protein